MFSHDFGVGKAFSQGFGLGEVLSPLVLGWKKDSSMILG